MTLNARRLHDAGHLRDGTTIRQAADVLWTYSAPELYELLVLRRGFACPRQRSHEHLETVGSSAQLTVPQSLTRTARRS